MEEPVPHLDMLPQTWESIQDVFKQLNHTILNNSSWIRKKRLLQLAGKPYLKMENGSKLFWIHLRILALGGNLPRYGSRNDKGIRVCFNSKKRQLTTQWCKKCCSLSCNAKCDECVKVIRFIKLPKPEILPPNPQDFTDFTIQHSSYSVLRSNFKGDDFTRYLLPLALGYTSNEKCFIPRFIQVILDSPLTDFGKVLGMLDGIYGKQKLAKQANLWIAPTHDDNDAISLTKPIKLTNHNTVGIATGKYFVWGFNCKHVSKWNNLQLNDYVLFGNTHNGFHRMGKVQKKFIWINDASCDIFSYFSTAGIWLYGFTITFEPIDFFIPGFALNAITGFHYQSQCKLKTNVKNDIAKKYPQLARFC